MKYTKLTPILIAFMVVATTASTYAFDIGIKTNLDTKIEKDSRDDSHDKNDDLVKLKLNSESNVVVNKKEEDREKEKFSNRTKSWVWNSGTQGEVTAVASTSLTIKSSSGEVYTVTTTDAMIRRSDKGNSSVSVGDNVYVFGIKNSNSIVASMIVVAKNKSDVKPTNEEKKQAYFGVITAKSDSSITILSKDNKTYTISNSSNTQIWINRTKHSSMSDLSIGDNVVVQGDISGDNIAAKNIVAIHLPTGTIIGKITAKNDISITVLASDNKSYTVLTTDASIKAKGGSLDLGDKVVAKGELTDTTLSAETISENKLKLGFFNRIGLFFKGIFSKK